MFSPASKPENRPKNSESNESQQKVPSISLPKGGGAINSIGEKFSANPVTGTGSLSVPIFTSPGRSGFGPQLSLSYDSGSGNGPFGFGWNHHPSHSITRKNDKGLPKYNDTIESDVFILSGAEDLVPLKETIEPRTIGNITYKIRRYRPRIEGLFARIERWTDITTGDIHWRSISKDNILTVYGRDKYSRIYDPANKSRVFSWLICESYDDKGNAVLYEYVAENSDNIDLNQANERNRVRTSNCYLKKIKYGNRQPLLLDLTKPGFRKIHLEQTDFSNVDWMFEVVFDYDEGHYTMLPPDENKTESEQHQYVQASVSPTKKWSDRPDSFSSYRAGFEVRTYRRCHRILMFHNISDLANEPYLVRSTEFEYSDLDYKSQPLGIDEELEYKGSTKFASFIQTVTQSGYAYDETKKAYIKKSLPSLEFEYSPIAIHEEIIPIDSDSLKNLPYGLDGSQYQLVDLEREGISGILTEHAEALYYKPNMGGGKFGPLVKIATKPSLAALNSGCQQLLSLAGDGQLDLALFEGSVQGFHERKLDQSWGNFTNFKSIPNVDWKDPNLKFIELSYDGHTDILIAEDNVFTRYPSLAKDGFGQAERIYQALDEEKGPHLLFYDGVQSIFLADMSGDGLTDLVRIRNGEVCYWPNLGYGRFGAKVTMDNSPLFDSFDLFDQKRILLADVDGSGTTDIIYLKFNVVDIYFNRSGNSLSEVRKLTNFPHIDNLSSLQVADLLGNGTACLIWSSPLTSDSHSPMQYVDLMGGIKPHLLTKSINNLGAETKVTYVASTKYYLDDKIKGKPWITRIPFPVHVVERVETYDRISRNRFVTRYAYHHGYFDGIEREFRGFGKVEQWDTEEIGNVDPEEMDTESTNLNVVSFIPPVLTRTWFHTGAYFEEGRISKQFEDEYYREGDPSLHEGELDTTQLVLKDTILPDNLTAEEAREACRSLKGSILRQEVYSCDRCPDGILTEESYRPYTVSERNYTIKCLQPQEGNKHAVFFVHPRETIDFHYERKLYKIGNAKLADPRVSHQMTLRVDDFGNIERSIAIGYSRRDLPDRQPEQAETHITLTQNLFINSPELPVKFPKLYSQEDQKDWYRVGLQAETQTYEIVNPPEPTASPISVSLLKLEIINALIEELFPSNTGEPNNSKIHHYEMWNWRKKSTTPNETRLRLIERVRTQYRKNNLKELLSFGQIDSLALPGETYKLAFTKSLVESIYERKLPGKSPEALISDPSAILGSKDSDGGGYIDLDGDGNWWIPSGRIFYSSDPANTSDQELAYASEHFFLPHRYRDPFHTDAVKTETFVSYDKYDLLLQETRDALGNCFTVGERKPNGDLDPDKPCNDYRVLQPKLVMDPNRNRTKVAFDALGMVVGTAVMGKPEDNPKHGDQLDKTFLTELTQAEIDKFFEDPKGQIATSLLDKATTRIIYNLTGYLREPDPNKKPPVFASTLARETHYSDSVPADGLKIQVNFSYSDGFGREIQKKIQAESGQVPKRDQATGVIITDANGLPEMTTDSFDRWVGSGWTIFNNKGKPVRQYEPFFTDTHRFEFDICIGVSPVLFYDPMERVVATLRPNHTYEKVVFDPWQQKTYDVNDTIMLDPWTDEDVKSYVSRYFATQTSTWQTWYQQRIGLSQGDSERNAAEKAAVHNDTPSTAYFDSLGRTFLTTVQNKFIRVENSTSVPLDEKYDIRVVFDIEGNQRTVIDALDRTVMRYDYDMLGNRIKQDSMDAGIRWMLSNVTGKQIYGWDSRDHRLRHAYDSLRRLTHIYLQQGSNAEQLVERTVYGESHPDSNTPVSGISSRGLNLRGKAFMQLDGAGVTINTGHNAQTSEEEAYDFKGNLLHTSRLLTTDYKNVVDWSAVEPLLSASLLDLTAIETALAQSYVGDETFTNSTTYDALNRPITLTMPDKSVIFPIYNEANLLESLSAKLRGKDSRKFIKNIDYNAKGQRELIEYGNDVITEYEYDPQTFRLITLFTTRGVQFLTDCSSQQHCSKPPKDCPKPRKQVCGVQNLHYTYDPTGNITHIRDDAQQTVYFSGSIIQPESDYTYDAIYRLIEAKGREHIGSAETPWPTWDDRGRTNLSQPGNPDQMRNYVEKYYYDSVGNFDSIQHWACNGNGTNPNNWKRLFTIDPDPSYHTKKKSNRLTVCTVGNQVSSQTGNFIYDSHGNMTSMPHLPTMAWDFKDQLQWVDKSKRNDETSGCRVYFTYDASGQRIRKVMEQDGKILNERIYIGGYEIYRKYKNDNKNPTPILIHERESLHIMDDKQRIALIDTKTIDINYDQKKLPETLIRYQFSNHLGSAVLELDEKADVISYEEYFPYGSTSYQAVRSNNPGSVEVSTKRYRYTGKERDEETGLYYHGARYYAPWLGRWVSCDPAGIIDGVNIYIFTCNNPVKFLDISGNATSLPPFPMPGSNPWNFVVESPWATSWEVAVESIFRGGSYKANLAIYRHSLSQMPKELQKVFAREIYNSTLSRFLTIEKNNPSVRYSFEQLENLLLKGNMPERGMNFHHFDKLIDNPELAIDYENLIITKGGEKSAVQTGSLHNYLHFSDEAKNLKAFLKGGSEVGKATASTAFAYLGLALMAYDFFEPVLTDNPERVGVFGVEPLFHPYAKTEKERSLNLTSQELGFPSYGVMRAILAYKAGCSQCLETYGMDMTNVPNQVLARGSLVYDPNKAEEFLSNIEKQNASDEPPMYKPDSKVSY